MMFKGSWGKVELTAHLNETYNSLRGVSCDFDALDLPALAGVDESDVERMFTTIRVGDGIDALAGLSTADAIVVCSRLAAWATECVGEAPDVEDAIDDLRRDVANALEEFASEMVEWAEKQCEVMQLRIYDLESEVEDLKDAMAQSVEDPE